MWFWPYNVKLWWIAEDLLVRLADKIRELRIAAQLGELNRLERSIAELSE